MRIVDLANEHEALYFVCLEDWSSVMPEAGDHKRVWYNKKKEEGLRVKLAVADNGEVGGMIQYLPIEHSFAEGTDLYLILCIWVHGYKQGRGNFQRNGMGSALLKAAEQDVRYMGMKGLAAWGISLPFWMKASWFKKMGYLRADKNGMQVLLWKPFTEDAVAPTLLKQQKTPDVIPGQVTVTAFRNGWCPVQNLICERARRAAIDVGDAVQFHEVDTSDRGTLLEWGICDSLYVDDKEMRTGPPPSYEKIRNAIAKKAKKLRRS